jgi:Ca-activated chloride channel homolog
MAERRVQLYADGVLRDSRVLVLDPQRKTDISIDDIDDPDHPASVVEVRLVAKDEAATAVPDPLGVDDRAWAIVPPARQRAVLLVGKGDPYLETALSYLPDTELWGTTPDRYASDVVRRDGTAWDLVIFEGFLPAELPPTPILAIAPPASSPLGTVAGTLTNPGIGSVDSSDPILRYVDLTTVHVGEARKMELPAWARPVIPGPGTSPLLYAGTLAGRPAAVMAFEPRRSDLPLQVAFPVLLANLAGELLGGSETPQDAIAPGAPVTLPIPAGAIGVRVERPDGSADELVAPAGGAPSVTFARTDLLGVYTVTPIADPAATPTPTSGPTGSAAASPSAAPSSPGASPTFRLADPSAPVRFAVGLLDVDESRIAPGDTAQLTSLGQPLASPGTGAGAPAERPNARDEIWIPVVLVALLVLTLEWLVYERDTLARLRRGLLARLRGTSASGRGA